MYLHRIIIIMIVLAASTVGVAAQSAFAPFPKAASTYWREQVPEAMRQDYIRLGMEHHGKAWQPIPNEVFAQFRTNGNRTNYEDSCFARRCQFACLVMAEVMEHRGRFMTAICSGLHYFLDKEPWWGLPAHYPKATPDSTIQEVDLFNAETSSMLAWTIYMLGDEINQTEKGLTEHTCNEIKRRFLTPTLTKRHGWMQSVNNWNTWIMSNFLESSLICYTPNSKELTKAMKSNEASLRLFIKGYPNDGGCEEGVGYWDRAGASFFESLWMRDAAKPDTTDTERYYRLTPTEVNKVAAMGRFITTMHINDLSFVNFSDAKVENIPNINILFPYGEWIVRSTQQPNDATTTQQQTGMQMMQFAAYIAKKYDYFSKPSTLFLQSGNWPTIGRELMLLSMLHKLKSTKPVQPRTTDAWLANSQIMVAGNGKWLIAAKGGNNAESHNHNDVGSFIITYNGKPALIDLGRDTYTSQTFSSRRYEMINNRSMYHNVPVINGYEQKDGSEYKGIDVDHTYTDSASVMIVDIAKAYPKEAGVKSWVRRMTLNRKQNKISIAEYIVMDNDSKPSADNSTTTAKSSEITLMCYGAPRQLKKGRIALANGTITLTYNPETVEASWSKLKMHEGIMKTQWNDNVFRIILKTRLKSGVVEYQFAEK